MEGGIGLKDKRIRLAGSLFITITAIIASIYFSTELHFVLTDKSTSLYLIPISQCIDSIWRDKTHQMLFLCMCGFSVLMGVMFYLTNNKPYQSDLNTILPGIETPVTAGQKQHGSATWLSDKEKVKEFGSFIVNNETKVIPEGGIVIGKKDILDGEQIFYIKEDVHAMCIGATRSGKSRTVVLQSICSLGLAGESLILSDPKGELYQYSYPFLQELGYEVLAVDFKNPMKSHRYNLLQPIIDAVDRDDMAKAIDLTWDLTSALVGEPKGERIWIDGEASIIAVLL